MRYFYDQEFLENGMTIELISIGIVAEDGREYYAVNEMVNAGELHASIRRHDWLMGNVVPHLPLARDGVWAHTPPTNSPKEFSLDLGSIKVKSLRQIRNEVREFTSACGEDASNPAELWGYFSAYDHVALMQLWGSMINRPKHLPMYTRDVRQEADRLGIAASLPKHPGGEHNALADARWHQLMWDFVTDYEQGLA
jgi:hypothetical protein